MTTLFRKLKSVVLLSTLFTGSIVYGQVNLETANKQFELNAYDLALENYKQILSEDPSCITCQLQMAESLRNLNRQADAKLAYERAMLKGALKENYLLGYGHTLKELGKYEEAKEVYNEFSNEHPVIGAYFAQSCDVAISYVDADVNYTANQFPFNTFLADKALSIHNGDLIIASFEKTGFQNHTKEWLTSEGTLLKVDAESLSDPVPLRRALIANNKINAISYAADNSICVFSITNNATNLSPVHQNEDTKSLYFSNQIADNGDFVSERAFPFNQTGSSSTHPCLSMDGKTLYFTSNKPGGFGGFDLYLSTLKNGNWTAPINLGENINSEGNEITPSINFDGELYFASDYQMGLGGFDIFKSIQDKQTWSLPVNLGGGVNTAADDYFPLLNRAGELSYVTSNRAGTSGGSDIYELNTIGNKTLVQLDTSEPLFEEEIRFEVSEDEAQPIFVMTEETRFEITEIESIDMLELELELDKAIRSMEVPEAYRIPVFASSDFDSDPNLKRVSIRSRKVSIPANVYFVQLASVSKSNGNLKSYKKASKHGNIYKIFKDNVVKIRVGYYGNRAEADQILKLVRSQGFKDAFITHDDLNMGAIELIYSNFDNYVAEEELTPIYNDVEEEESNISNYKVRLAAYDNPLYFDVASVKGIAKLEQWSKGDWTIFLLSGFTTLKEAELAKIKAINRGFVDAYIVIDNGGVLEKLNQN